MKISAVIGLIVATLAIIVSFVYAYYRAKQDEAELREQRIELSAYIDESLAKDGYSKDGQSAWQIADDWSSDYYGGKPVADLKSTTQHLDLAAKTKSMAGMPTPEMVEAGWRPEYSIESVQIVQAGDAPGGLILMAGKRPDGGKTVIAYKVDLKENGG